MEVTALGGADGMLFRFGADQSGSFWMKDTVLPLSIAFFHWAAPSSRRPTWSRARRRRRLPDLRGRRCYADALEVPEGGLAALGIGPTSRLAVTTTSCAPSR